MGLYFQWGRKDPFVFPISSESWGADHQRGKYPVKIYTIDGVLIYQQNDGGSNKDKQPVGGIIVSSIVAASMMETVKNPIVYLSTWGAIIVQTGQSQALWNYYWTSYSRGTDGKAGNLKYHNDYLDGYISQRSKSIYDPCPFGFRIFSNGSYADFKPQTGWLANSYIGGCVWKLTNNTWLVAIGQRSTTIGVCEDLGRSLSLYNSTIGFQSQAYTWRIQSDLKIELSNILSHSHGLSVRCIEELCSSSFFGLSSQHLPFGTTKLTI